MTTMDNDEFHFLQNALRKHTSNEHMTYYEKARVGRHFSQDLPTARFDTLKEIAAEQFPKEEEKVGDYRKASFEKFANDLRMDQPIMITEDLLFHVLVYDAVKEKTL